MGGSSRRAQLPFEHGNENGFPARLLPHDGVAGVEPFFEIQTGLRLAKAQDAPTIGELEQEEFNVAFHKLSDRPELDAGAFQKPPANSRRPQI